MRGLEKISMTCAIKIQDRIDHSHPHRKLFQDVYRAYLPEINILTKSENISKVKKQNSVVVRRQAERQQRMRKLQMPRTKIMTDTTQQSTSLSISLSPKRRQSLPKPPHQQNNSLFYIYKSEMQQLQDKIYPETPQMWSIRKMHKTIQTEQSNEKDHFQRQLSPRRFKALSSNSHRPIQYNGEQSSLLSRIFDTHCYDDTFEHANHLLLKKEKVYKSKEWKLDNKNEWRV